MKLHPPLAAIFISLIAISLLNSLGLLKVVERQVYDFWLRVRPLEAQDESIVIIGIQEQDLAKYGFPLSDRTLANLLLAIKQQNPSAIGMDLHRNVSVGSGEKKLEEVYKSTDNLIGVEKTDGGNPHHESITPPVELEKLGQTGASQIIEDNNNGIVRRGYLYVNQSTKDEMLPGLGLAIALKHLEQKGIMPSGYGPSNWLQLKNAVFPSIDDNLFYELSDLDGYQTLINYRSTNQKFKQVSVSDVLENKIKGDLLKDKIIIIGSMAETVDDLYLTPYNSSSQNSNFVYGVEIHAEIASQIINAALNERVIVKTTPIIGQYISLVLGLIIVSFSSWYLFLNIEAQNKQAILYCIYSVISLIIIGAGGYALLLLGWWMPTATILLGSWFSECIIYIFLLKNTIRIKNQKLSEARKQILSQEKLTVYNQSVKLIAHEIKNKINIMQSSVELAVTELKEWQLFIEERAFLFETEEESAATNLTKNIEDELAIIKRESQKITSIINRIYASSINKKIEDREPITANLIESVDKIIMDLKHKYDLRHPQNQIEVIKNYQLSSSPSRKISLEIERALENIIENAFYFLGKKNELLTDDWTPRLEIVVRSLESWIEIKIRDNGVGIAAKNLDKIFSDFWTTKSVGEGMGLGLYIAKESVEKHQGSISVSSVEEEYTEFMVKLPDEMTD